jgi:hypothetical protein
MAFQHSATSTNSCYGTILRMHSCFVAGLSRMSLFVLLWDANVQEKRKMAVGLEEQVMSALAGALIGAIGPSHLLDRHRGMSSSCLSTDFISRCRLLLIVCGLSSWTRSIYSVLNRILSLSECFDSLSYPDSKHHNRLRCFTADARSRISWSKSFVVHVSEPSPSSCSMVSRWNFDVGARRWKN